MRRTTLRMDTSALEDAPGGEEYRLLSYDASLAGGGGHAASGSSARMFD